MDWGCFRIGAEEIMWTQQRWSDRRCRKLHDGPAELWFLRKDKYNEVEEDEMCRGSSTSGKKKSTLLSRNNSPQSSISKNKA
jgi:hypothetical protein